MTMFSDSYRRSEANRMAEMRAIRRNRARVMRGCTEGQHSPYNPYIDDYCGCTEGQHSPCNPYIDDYCGCTEGQHSPYNPYIDDYCGAGCGDGLCDGLCSTCGRD